MDTSETYIKMCEKATEIQNKSLIGGDFYTGKNVIGYGGEGWNIVKWSDQKRTVGGIGNTTELIRHDRADVIWLPRQDQLQEMVRQKHYDLDDEVEEFVSEFIDGEYIEMPSWSIPEKSKEIFLLSWEQLWLAFVMKEKYNKVWNGEDWV